MSFNGENAWNEKNEKEAWHDEADEELYDGELSFNEDRKEEAGVGNEMASDEAARSERDIWRFEEDSEEEEVDQEEGRVHEAHVVKDAMLRVEEEAHRVELVRLETALEVAKKNWKTAYDEEQNAWIAMKHIDVLDQSVKANEVRKTLNKY